ncbi:MAG: MFS transporter [Gammaproteobacteria bacterium]
MNNHKKMDVSTWLPLRYPFFKMLWIAAVFSNIGSWMHEVGAAWLMTSLTNKPLLIALVQSASTLPIFLLALPAGALADVLDKRHFLIVLQACMAITAGVLAVAVFYNHITPLSLLLFTLTLGSFNALDAPGWQAIVPELVTAEAMPPAIALMGGAINISRAFGPALAGFIITLSGPAAVFAFNSISFLGVIIVFWLWRHEKVTSTLPAERLMGAMRAGFRYVRSSPALHNVLVRTFTFFIFVSASWALLPLVVRKKLGLGAGSYGALLSLLGVGAILAAVWLPKLHKRYNPDQLTNKGTLVFSLSILLLALSNNFYLICGGMLLGGVAWMVVLATLNTAAQFAVASWVRARALAIYLVAFFGGLSLGSILWGAVATHLSLATTLLIAGIGMICSNILSRFFTLEKSLKLDHTPTGHMPAPKVVGPIESDQGPVMITVEYEVSPSQQKDFVEVMQNARRIRLREGAFFWNLFNNIDDPNCFIECYIVESWLEHLRQHERISVSDRKVQDRADSFHRGSKPPLISHFVAYNYSRNEKTTPEEPLNCPY